MMKRPEVAWFAVLLLVLVAACGEDAKSDPPDAPTEDADTRDASGTDTQDTEDIGTEDVAPDTPPAGCGGDADCPEGARCISDGRCLIRWDRSCAIDADCRADETCQDLGGALGCKRNPQPIIACPGSAQCPATEDQTLLGGAAAVPISPTGFEQPLPEFDFKLSPDGPYITEPPGDHYTETNSVGPSHLPLLLDKFTHLLEALE